MKIMWTRTLFTKTS